jgi:hypothetical protein
MKTYDFRLVIRRAEFNPNGQVSIPYGSSSDVYAEECFEGTLKGAQQRLSELSGRERRPHAGFISMKYRDDSKPRGYGQLKPLYFNGESTNR